MKISSMLTLALMLFSFAGIGKAHAAAPCEKDVARYCYNMSFGDIARCLLANEDQISKGCRQRLDSGINKTRKCRTAISDICGAAVTEIGNGLGVCMVQNERALGAACRQGDK